MSIPIPISIAPTAGSNTLSPSTDDECYFQTPSLMDPSWILNHNHFQDPADAMINGGGNNGDEEFVRLQAAIFQELEKDPEEARFLELPKNTPNIDLEPLLAAADMMALPLNVSTSSIVAPPQERSLVATTDDLHCQQPTCYSFLVPVSTASFQDQDLPRKRGRPALIRMDALPNRRVAGSSPSSPCGRRVGNINCTNGIHSPRSEDHLPTSTPWSVGPETPIPLTSMPLSTFAPTPMVAPMVALDCPSNFSTLPYNYFLCLSQSDSLSLSHPTSSLPIWMSLSSSPLPSLSPIPPVSLAPCESTYSSSSPPSSLTFSASSTPSPQPSLQLSSSSLSSSCSAQSKMSPCSIPTEFYIMRPYQHSDKKVDRRSFNSRKELKQAQAKAQAQQAHAPSHFRSPAR